MSVIVPTADQMSAVGSEHRIGRAGLVVAMALVVWPVAAVISSAEPDPPTRAVGLIQPPTAEAGAWSAAFLDGGYGRVVGLGSVVVAVDRDGIWPVSLLRGGSWQRLLGMPVGIEVAAGVGSSTEAGFVVAGVAGQRTVLYQYDHRGRFLGARTVFDVRTGLVSTAGSDVVVFDQDAPAGVVVGHGSFPVPARVVDAAPLGRGMAVLTDDGIIHVTPLVGEEWIEVGGGFTDLVGSGPVYAVGSSASVGIAEVTEAGTLVRVEGAPVGPTVAWGDRLAVYDWSTDSVWNLTSDGWERLPLWKSRGFGATFVGMIDAAPWPAVLGESERGPAVWQISG